MGGKYLGLVETQYHMSCKKTCIQISGSQAEKIFVATCLVPQVTGFGKTKSSKLESPTTIFLVARGLKPAAPALVTLGHACSSLPTVRLKMLCLGQSDVKQPVTIFQITHTNASHFSSGAIKRGAAHATSTDIFH